MNPLHVAVLLAALFTIVVAVAIGLAAAVI